MLLYKLYFDNFRHFVNISYLSEKALIDQNENKVGSGMVFFAFNFFREESVFQYLK